MSTLKNSEISDNLVVEKAVGLSLIEVFVGSFLHAIRLPFSGHFLSLNQGLYLTEMIRGNDNRFIAAKNVIEVSTVAAIMKSVGPAGKKLGPMMSISAQGSLYAAGITIMGTNIIGQMLAMVLLSLWAFLQPFITYILIYGPDFFKAFEYFLSKIQKYIHLSENTLFLSIAAIIGFKAIFALLIPLISERFQLYSKIEKLVSKALPQRKTSRSLTPLKGALKDLFRPSLLISFLIMALFFYLNGLEQALIFWKIMRSLAIAFILFYLGRSPLFKRLCYRWALKNKSFNRLYELSSLAGQEVRRRLG